MTFNFWLTRIWSARSPSVRATRVRRASGSRRWTSATTSSTTAALPFNRLAQTRLFWGLGGGGDWSLLVLVWTRNRLSTTCSGVRIQGWRVNTAATVAIFFRLAFCPLVRRTERSLRGGLTMGMPLQSTATTRIEAAGEEGLAGRWA